MFNFVIQVSVWIIFLLEIIMNMRTQQDCIDINLKIDDFFELSAACWRRNVTRVDCAVLTIFSASSES